MIEKAFEAIEKTDIELLIQQKVREKRTIEYKQSLPGKSDADTREFLADVSSFANAFGGDVLYGVAAEDGVPVAVKGIGGNIDSEIVRLESVIRTGIEPRLPAMQIRAIEGFEGGAVVLIRIGKSWLSPHIVKFQNLSRFFTRTSAGKSQMDVVELRSAFLASNTIVQAISQFRSNRVAKIISDATPIPIDERSRLVLHLLPVAAFASDLAINVASLGTGDVYIPPLNSRGYNRRLNLDGVLSFTKNTYCQVYRNGCIEAVGGGLVYKNQEGHLLMGSGYELGVVKKIATYVYILRKMQIPCPISISFSLIGVKGVKIVASDFFEDNEVIDQDVVMLPDVLVSDYDAISTEKDIAKLMRPAFDIVWNASGRVESCNFDETGAWRHE